MAIDLEKVFTYHSPKEFQIELYNKIRKLGKDFGELLNTLAPESREKSLAATKIEEAVMWANAHIARNS